MRHGVDGMVIRCGTDSVDGTIPETILLHVQETSMKFKDVCLKFFVLGHKTGDSFFDYAKLNTEVFARVPDGEKGPDYLRDGVHAVRRG